MQFRSAAVAWAAFAVIFTAGAAQGLSGTNTVTSDDIVDGAVHTADLASSAVTSSRIASSGVTASDIATGAVHSADVSDNSLTGADINESTLNLNTQIYTVNSPGITGTDMNGATLGRASCDIGDKVLGGGGVSDTLVMDGGKPIDGHGNGIDDTWQAYFDKFSGTVDPMTDSITVYAICLRHAV